MPNWWEKTLPNDSFRWESYKVWIGDNTQPSKVICRRYIADKKYESILDCGCGLCTESDGYESMGYKIKYTGIDFTKFLVEKNVARGIDCIHGKVNKMHMFSDNQFDVVYARHLLEHMAVHQAYQAITEMIRVAKKEVIIVWFIPPSNKGYDKAVYSYFHNEDQGLYHNEYSEQAMRFHISTHRKVANVRTHRIKGDDSDMYPEDINFLKDTDPVPQEIPKDDGMQKESIWFIQLHN
jgi:ubiquinone/menaquinone biosynthesis C-methylase UbiE